MPAARNYGVKLYAELVGELAALGEKFLTLPATLVPSISQYTNTLFIIQ